MLGVVPLSMTRVSPNIGLSAPDPSLDSEPCDGKQTSQEDIPMPIPPSRWSVDLFRVWARQYPDNQVGNIASEAVGEGLNPGFVGKMMKSVIRPNPSSICGQEEAIRDELISEVEAGRIAGPFTRPPCAYYRNCPLRMIRKEPHVPDSTKMRLISNFSSGKFSVHGLSSVNDLCATPNLVGFHLKPQHLRDVIASKGKGCSVWASDIPKCFRGQRNLKELLRLFVYTINTSSRPQEFFVDLCNPFGWTPAEYSWQCILAVLLWRFRLDGVTELMAYVDNFPSFRL